MSSVCIEVEAEVKPTEDPEKVKRAILNLFPASKLETVERAGRTFLTTSLDGRESLRMFKDRLKIQRIRDAARAHLLARAAGNKIMFYLNKQVAYVGRISFSQAEYESPLGPIKVKITCDKPRELIDWLSPSSRAR